MKRLCGVGCEFIPDVAFTLMSWCFVVRDMFSPRDKVLAGFGIQPGDTVIDYGCGPGSYVRPGAELVGAEGKYYAVDVHRMAIKAVNKRIDKFRLTNVEAVAVTGYACPLPDHTADVIFALDMFHHIEDPDTFLRELHRMLKPSGFLILEDGHQPREQTKRKVLDTRIWKIAKEQQAYLKCVPLESK